VYYNKVPVTQTYTSLAADLSSSAASTEAPEQQYSGLLAATAGAGVERDTCFADSE
jgi:hypothetical protein